MIGPRKADKPLVLYGYGRLGHLAEEIFTELDIPVLIWDKKLPCPVAQYPEDFLLAICIASEPYTPIRNSLREQGWTDIVPVWDILEYYTDKTGIGNGWFARPTDETVTDGWADKNSYFHYSVFLYWRLCRKEWVIVGMEPKEALPSTLADIRARQNLNSGIFFSLNSSLLDHVTIHNEGYELQTLHDHIWDIQAHRPLLEVACYHSRDGLWKIPKFLMDNLKDYTFRFRMTAYQGQGAYITCIPNERREK